MVTSPPVAKNETKSKHSIHSLKFASRAHENACPTKNNPANMQIFFRWQFTDIAGKTWLCLNEKTASDSDNEGCYCTIHPCKSQWQQVSKSRFNNKTTKTLNLRFSRATHISGFSLPSPAENTELFKPNNNSKLQISLKQCYSFLKEISNKYERKRCFMAFK